MQSEPSDPEFEAVLRLPPLERYLHFLKRIVDLDAVWMAADDAGLVYFGDDNGRDVLPVWPARRYAENAMHKMPEVGFVRKSIADWLENTLRPVADEMDVALAVFVDAEGYAESVLIPDMIKDLEGELGSRLQSQPGFDPDAEEIDLDELLRPAMRASMKAKPKGRLP